MTEPTGPKWICSYQGESGPGLDAQMRLADSTLFNAFLARGSRVCPPDTRLSHPSDGAEFIHALFERLRPLPVGSAHWPMQFVICLARRGRIKVSTRLERQGWSIWLAAERPDTRQWLVGQQQRCQQSLARRLGQPVRVQLMFGDLP